METIMETNGCEIRFENCGDILRDARKEKDISIRDLADMIPCDRGKLSKIETNKLALSLTLLQQIAEALDVPAEKIVLKCLELRFPKLRSTKAGAIAVGLLVPKRKGQA